MKQILVLLLCVYSMSSYAQVSIEKDETDARGYRHISTTEFKCWHGVDGAGFWKDAIARLSLVSKDNAHLFQLEIELKSSNLFKTLEVPKNGKLLIRLNNDDIIELINISDLNTSTGYYSISEEQLLSIGNGVKKMRVETSKKYIDFKFKKGSQFAGLLNSAYELVLEHITYGNQLGTKKDVHIGF